MGNGESGRANASLVISMLALLMAVTGVATAAKNKGDVKLPPNSVGSAQLKPGAVKAPDLGKNSVVASKVAADAVTTKALADNAVTAAVLAPSSVTSQALSQNSVLASSLAPQSVTAMAIASNAVDAGKIKDDAVGADKLKAGAVTSDAIAAGAVGSSALMAGAVTTQKLSDKAVDKNKIDDDAVDTSQIVAGAVNAAKIAPRAVTAPKIDSTPGAQVSTDGTAMDFNFMTCYAKFDAPFSMVDRNLSAVYSPSNPERLTAPISGIYRVTAGVTWPDAGGTVRGLGVERNIGSGPNIGQHYTVQSVSTAPAVGSPTDQTLTFDVALDQGDYVTADFTTCGVNTSTTKSNFGMNWTGPAN